MLFVQVIPRLGIVPELPTYGCRSCGVLESEEQGPAEHELM
jgi:hypothetical protein